MLWVGVGVVVMVVALDCVVGCCSVVGWWFVLVLNLQCVLLGTCFLCGCGGFGFFGCCVSFRFGGCLFGSFMVLIRFGFGFCDS